MHIRHLIDTGQVAIVRVPTADTTFRTPDGDHLPWVAIAPAFQESLPVSSWFDYAVAQAFGETDAVPDLGGFLREHGYHQLGNGGRITLLLVRHATGIEIVELNRIGTTTSRADIEEAVRQLRRFDDGDAASDLGIGYVSDSEGQRSLGARRASYASGVDRRKYPEHDWGGTHISEKSG